MLITLLVISPLLAWLAWKDLRERRLPNKLTCVLAFAAFAMRIVTGGVAGGVDGILGGLVCGGFVLAAYLARAAGGGDVKMAFACGIAAGLRLCVMELLAVSLIGVVLSVVLLCLKQIQFARKAGLQVPFGVALALGTVTALLWGAFR